MRLHASRHFFPASAVAAILLLSRALADGPSLPGHGFEASHYETLWTKSPFAVATSDAPPDSPDYDLVGIAEFDGISYASLVDKHSNNEHFLITGNKPERGVSLVSITRGQGSADTVAVVQKDGQTLTLKLTAPAASIASTTPVSMPSMIPPIPMPGSVNPTPTSPFMMPAAPGVRFHRATINIPPRFPGGYYHGAGVRTARPVLSPTQ